MTFPFQLDGFFVCNCFGRRQYKQILNEQNLIEQKVKKGWVLKLRDVFLRKNCVQVPVFFDIGYLTIII